MSTNQDNQASGRIDLSDEQVENIKLLISDLRSGKYKQIKGAFASGCDESCRCALGVALSRVDGDFEFRFGRGEAPEFILAGKYQAFKYACAFGSGDFWNRHLGGSVAVKVFSANDVLNQSFEDIAGMLEEFLDTRDISSLSVV